MARKGDLRRQRVGTVINLTSKKQESELGGALQDVVATLEKEFGAQLVHEPSWVLRDVIAGLHASNDASPRSPRFSAAEPPRHTG